MGVGFCGVLFDLFPCVDGFWGEGLAALGEVVFGFTDVFVGGFVGELAV